MALQLNDASLFKDRAFIDGEWVEAVAGRRFDVLDPATGEKLGSVPDMGPEDAKHAIEAANRAWPEWRAMSAKKRYYLLRRWYELIMENVEDLARILTAEQGKPLRESRGEVAYGASYVEWFAEEAKRVTGDILPTISNDRRLLVLKQPVGVVAAITPWNYPSAMITRKLAPALAAGCTVVLKPAEDTPLSALALAELAIRAGIPAGVLNIVTAAQGVEIGKEFTANPTVRKISFTGSTAVGKLLMAQAASTVKKVSLELGGNAPFIVFEDADLDAAAAAAFGSKFVNSGQACVCVNRVLVQESVYEAFLERLGKLLPKIRPGHGAAEETTQGPLINRRAFEKVDSLVQDALAKGARLLAGGQRHEAGENFYQPTLLADVSPDMACFQQEIFGPVMPVTRFSTEEEAIRIANDTPYGLAAYFFTRDVGRMWRVGEALEYGMVGINEGMGGSELIPFGGIKESGIGREGSKYGIEEYLEIKYLGFAGLARN
ncbi:MAG: NAD-dependent succinate-semialdehyde dehydrogenase [Xanthomonadaceae bacterium]|nr:NAD-dependent succinate-semialdehyde dehydrogenase [Xanthomonadaceae bacterium]